MATGVDEEKAEVILKLSGYSVKNAILMLLANVDFDTSKKTLDKYEGRIHLGLEALLNQMKA